MAATSTLKPIQTSGQQKTLAARSSTPKTPTSNQRTISAAYSSPGAWGREIEEVIVYELSPRHFSAGFAGESRPRCIWRFGYAQNERMRVGDYSHLDPRLNARSRLWQPAPAKDYELYQSDLRGFDFSLARARFERVVRAIHIEQLQTNQNLRRAALVVSSLTPTKIIDLVLDVLFNHYAQPPSITLLTNPIMSCVSAGVRDGLVIELGWEETIITAVCEYKSVFERRSIRGGKMLVEAFEKLLRTAHNKEAESTLIDFAFAEDVRDRLAWCKSGSADSDPDKIQPVTIPLPQDDQIKLSFESLSAVVEDTFFLLQAWPGQETIPDDDEHTLHMLAYEVLRELQQDARSICAARIIIDGPQSHIPGLRRRVLELLQQLIDKHCWRDVREAHAQSRTTYHDSKASHSSGATTPTYVDAQSDTGLIDTVAEGTLAGSRATSSKVDSDTTTELDQMSATPTAQTPDVAPMSPDLSISPESTTKKKHIPAAERLHDDIDDKVTLKAERESAKRKSQTFCGQVRGVHSLGAWSGASMVASMRIKGICEVEREDFLKHGLRDSIALLI